ncbi:MAG: hypothetical protein ABI665_07735 [Vicinamibacterales bacterium]
MSVTAETPATLTIVRDHPMDVQDRPVYLWVDGEKWTGILRFGKTFTRELAPGRHTIKAHNTLFGHTIEIDAAPGEAIKLRCSNGLTGGGMVMVLMLGVAYLRVRLERI